MKYNTDIPIVKDCIFWSTQSLPHHKPNNKIASPILRHKIDGLKQLKPNPVAGTKWKGKIPEILVIVAG